MQILSVCVISFGIAGPVTALSFQVEKIGADLTGMFNFDRAGSATALAI